MKNETNKTEKTYTRNDVEILIKRIDKRFDDAIEFLTKDTGEKIEKAKTELGSMIESVDEKVQILAENVVGMDHRLVRVEQKVDRLQDDTVEVKYELKQKPSADDFKKLEKRVTKLERLSLAH